MLRVDLIRGQDPGAERLAWLEQTARTTGAGESLVAGLGSVAAARQMLGDDAGARSLLAEVVTLPDVGSWWWFTLSAHPGSYGDGTRRARPRLSDGRVSGTPDAVHAARRRSREGARSSRLAATAWAASDAYADAVQRWEGLGVIPELGHALLGRGRTLRGAGPVRRSPDRARAGPGHLRAPPCAARAPGHRCGHQRDDPSGLLDHWRVPRHRSSSRPPEAGQGRGLVHPRRDLGFVDVATDSEVHAARRPCPSRSVHRPGSGASDVPRPNVSLTWPANPPHGSTSRH